MISLKIILIIAVGVIIGLAIAYLLKVPLVVELVDMLKAKIASLNIAGVDLGSIFSISSVVGLAGLGYQLYTTHKDKVAAQAENAKQLLANKELYEGYSNVTGQLDQVTKAKDQALQTLEDKTKEFQGLADEVNLLRKEVEKKDLVVDDLQELLQKVREGKVQIQNKVI